MVKREAVLQGCCFKYGKCGLEDCKLLTEAWETRAKSDFYGYTQHRPNSVILMSWTIRKKLNYRFRTMDFNGKILIVGGYGAVGKTISAALADLFPQKVVVAGRNYQKAKDFSVELDQKVTPLKFDSSSISENDERLDDISVVVMCIDQTDTTFVTQCIKRGIHYIDITANYDVLSKIESLDSLAKNHSSTVVLSVGLAPGLTNLLAARSKQVVKNVQFANIYVLLGLGEKHGKAAYKWTFDDFNDEFFVKEDGERIRVKSFEDGKQTLFPGTIGKRTAYRSNFSDQHVIPWTLDIHSVSTRMCFDSAFITRLYALIKKTFIRKLFTLDAVQNLLIKAFKVSKFGTDQFALKVDAGVTQGQGALFECSIIGNGQGKTTGLVAAKVAEKLITTSFEGGVYHIEQLFDPVAFINEFNDVLEYKEEIISGKSPSFLDEGLLLLCSARS